MAASAARRRNYSGPKSLNYKNSGDVQVLFYGGGRPSPFVIPNGQLRQPERFPKENGIIHKRSSEEGFPDLVEALILGRQEEATRILGEIGTSMDEKKNTVLHDACNYRDAGMLRWILRALVNPKVTPNTAGRTCVHVAVSTGSVGLVKVLLETFSKYQLALLQEGDQEGYNSLHTAANGGHLEVVTYILRLFKRELLFSTTKRGQTALHVAVIAGHLPVVKALSQAMKKATFLKDSKGFNAAYCGCLARQNMCVLHLLQHDALTANILSRDQANLLHAAAEGGCSVELVKTILSKMDSRIAATPSAARNTPLHVAAIFGQTEILSLLLTTRLFQRLVNASNWKGVIPAQCAAVNRHVHCLAILLRYKADIYQQNMFNESVVSLVEDSSDDRLRRLLQSHQVILRITEPGRQPIEPMRQPLNQLILPRSTRGRGYLPHENQQRFLSSIFLPVHDAQQPHQADSSRSIMTEEMTSNTNGPGSNNTRSNYSTRDFITRVKVPAAPSSAEMREAGNIATSNGTAFMSTGESLLYNDSQSENLLSNQSKYHTIIHLTDEDTTSSEYFQKERDERVMHHPSSDVVTGLLRMNSETSSLKESSNEGNRSSSAASSPLVNGSSGEHDVNHVGGATHGEILGQIEVSGSIYEYIEPRSRPRGQAYSSSETHQGSSVVTRKEVSPTEPENQSLVTSTGNRDVATEIANMTGMPSISADELLQAAVESEQKNKKTGKVSSNQPSEILEDRAEVGSTTRETTTATANKSNSPTMATVLQELKSTQNHTQQTSQGLQSHDDDKRKNEGMSQSSTYGPTTAAEEGPESLYAVVDRTAKSVRFDPSETTIGKDNQKIINTQDNESLISSTDIMRNNQVESAGANESEHPLEMNGMSRKVNVHPGVVSVTLDSANSFPSQHDDEADRLEQAYLRDASSSLNRRNSRSNAMGTTPNDKAGYEKENAVTGPAPIPNSEEENHESSVSLSVQELKKRFMAPITQHSKTSRDSDSIQHRRSRRTHTQMADLQIIDRQDSLQSDNQTDNYPGPNSPIQSEILPSSPDHLASSKNYKVNYRAYSKHVLQKKQTKSNLFEYE